MHAHQNDDHKLCPLMILFIIEIKCLFPFNLTFAQFLRYIQKLIITFRRLYFGNHQFINGTQTEII